MKGSEGLYLQLTNEADSNYDALRRGYPARIDGELKSYHYDRLKREFFVTWKGKTNDYEKPPV